MTKTTGLAGATETNESASWAKGQVLNLKNTGAELFKGKT